MEDSDATREPRRFIEQLRTFRTVMNLNDLLKLDSEIIDSSKICMMRHTPRELGDYLLDPTIFEFYTSVQKKGKLDKYEYIMGFLVNNTGKTVFRGIYEILGKEPLQSVHYTKLFITDSICKQYKWLEKTGEYQFYNVRKISALADYDGRVVIDWGRAAVAWFQSYHESKPKEVVEIFPRGFLRSFEDYSSVSLTRFELEYLLKNADANSAWKSHLSRVSGVYLILDEGTGQQYIGSAYGVNGIWGRWNAYFKDPTGGNMQLRRLLVSDPEAYKRFRYSLLEVIPGNALKDEAIKRETLYKKKLGTKAFGLNEN